MIRFADVYSRAVRAAPAGLQVRLHRERFLLRAGEPVSLERIRSYLPAACTEPGSDELDGITIVEHTSDELSSELDRWTERCAPAWQEETFPGEHRAAFLLDDAAGEPLSLFRLLGPDGHWVVRAGDRVLLVASRQSRDRERLLSRLFREVAFRLLEDRGFVALHGAAVAFAGAGALVLGASGSGKTTLLLALVQHLGASYVVNDHTLVRGGPLRVGCFPLPLRIGWGSACAVKQLRDHPEVRRWAEARQWEATSRYLSDWGASNKLELSPRDLAAGFGCDLEEEVSLRLVLLPALEPGEHPIQVDEVPGDQLIEVLLAACYTPRDKRWKRPWVQPRSIPDPELARRATALLRSVADGIRCVRVRFGTDLAERLAADPVARAALLSMEHA